MATLPIPTGKDSSPAPAATRGISPSRFREDDNNRLRTSTEPDALARMGSGERLAGVTRAGRSGTAEAIAREVTERQGATDDAPLESEKARVDRLFQAVGQMYYRVPPRTSYPPGKVDPKALTGPVTWSSEEFDKIEYATLDMLTSPLRKGHVLDAWTAREIATFEAGMCSLGKDFHAIQKLVKTKTTNELVDFYYIWKSSSHYQVWSFLPLSRCLSSL
jgi:hypothetical protein